MRLKKGSVMGALNQRRWGARVLALAVGVAGVVWGSGCLLAAAGAGAAGGYVVGHDQGQQDANNANHANNGQ